MAAEGNNLNSPDENRQLILLVEDDDSVRSAVEGLLMGAGYLVKSAGNGLHASQLLKTGAHFHLILSDLKMPGQTGLQLLHHVRTDKRYGKIPFLIFTASMNKAELMTAVRLGVSDYLLKPTRNKDLLEKIRKALDADTAPPQVA